MLPDVAERDADVLVQIIPAAEQSQAQAASPAAGRHWLGTRQSGCAAVAVPLARLGQACF